MYRAFFFFWRRRGGPPDTVVTPYLIIAVSGIGVRVDYRIVIVFFASLPFLFYLCSSYTSRLLRPRFFVFYLCASFLLASFIFGRFFLILVFQFWTPRPWLQIFTSALWSQHAVSAHLCCSTCLASRSFTCLFYIFQSLFYFILFYFILFFSFLSFSYF
jgi:hypothetical protein